MQEVRFAGAALLAAVLLTSQISFAAETEKPQFEKNVGPIFAAHCTKCHNSTKLTAGLDLSSLAGVVKGSGNGAVVVAGAPDKSVLFQRVSSKSMPPKSQPPLDAGDIETIRQWIETGLTGETAAASAAASGITFENDVQPVLAKRCFGCHGTDKPAAGLDLRTAATVLRGSSQGPVVVKGEADKSPLVQRVANHTMPPKATGQTLTTAEIEIIHHWVDAGAPSKEAVTAVAAAAAPVANSAAPITEKDREFWAFRKPVTHPVPKVKDAKRVRTPIDAFLLAKLEAKGLNFSPDASKLTLMRRAYYDLTGVPPTLEELTAYLSDNRPDAYDRLLERLFASPQYGERWGRHWLDLAGYNDEQGFANDIAKTEVVDGMWRYRDYVIRSFNADKPYSTFLTEQLAGDELVDWKSAPKYTQEIRDLLTATGYLRLQQDLTEADQVNSPPYYYDVLSHLVDSYTTGVLGLTGNCARCHNHKYDPISQHDYYSIAAVFATGYNLDHWKKPKDRFLPDVSKSEQAEIDKFNAEIDRPIAAYQKQLDTIRKPIENRLKDEKFQAMVPELFRDDVKGALSTPAEKRTGVQTYLVRKFGALLKVPPADVDKAMTDAERASAKELSDKIAVYKGWRKSYGKIQALWDTGKPSTIHVLRRGAYETPGEVVPPGFMAILSPEGGAVAKPPSDIRGDALGYRLALARWTASPDNPLTARVFVNRVWQHLFGKGIVATTDNFGRMGAAPSNQDLLDWIAVDFMEHGWKIKRLQKMMMMSTAYRQSSQQPTENVRFLAEQVDEGNDLLWRMNLRRADAEVVRDSVLESSGKLDLTAGGPPVELDSTKDGLVTVSSKGASGQEFRRSVYLLARRNYSTSLLDVFDFPVMALNCTRRTNSATPLQSLTMLNSDFILKRAADMATRVADLAGPKASEQQEVALAFKLALSRDPKPEETGMTVAHMDKIRDRYLDLKTPSDDASRKALTSVCQMLMATNEFLYID